MPDDGLGLDLLLLDGRHLLWRSLSVFTGLSVEDPDHEKVETGGIYGFLRLALGCWLKFGQSSEAVTIVAWDLAEGPTVRRKLYSEYKNKKHAPAPPRPSGMPHFDRASVATVERDLVREAMAVQEPKLKEILSLLGVAQASAPGWEADDVLATICARYKDTRIGILSGDRDLLQLVTDNITLIRPLSGGKFALETPAQVREEHGVEPLQILDLKTLAGDTGDNIPGARGIGAKGAAKLIQTHGSWDRALDVALATKAEKGVMKLLAASEEAVRLSAKLVALNRAAKLSWILAQRDGKRAFLEMTKLRFNSLMADGRRDLLMQMGGP